MARGRSFLVLTGYMSKIPLRREREGMEFQNIKSQINRLDTR